jgi:hypothetical protein
MRDTASSGRREASQTPPEKPLKNNSLSPPSSRSSPKSSHNRLRSPTKVNRTLADSQNQLKALPRSEPSRFTVSPSHTCQAKISFNVTTLMGQNVAISLPPTATVGDIKDQIALAIGVPRETQSLIFVNSELKYDSENIQRLGIQEGSHLRLVTRMTGGNSFISWH